MPSPSGKVSLATEGDNKSLLCLALHFLSPIGLTFISFRQSTSNLFCCFATFPPLQRRNLPPKEEAGGQSTTCRQANTTLRSKISLPTGNITCRKALSVPVLRDAVGVVPYGFTQKPAVRQYHFAKQNITLVLRDVGGAVPYDYE